MAVGTKRVTIQATYKGTNHSLDLARVTEVKESEEIDSDVVKCFDGAVPVPSSDGGYSIDISTLEARDLNEFITLKRILKGLKTNPGTLSVYEDIKQSTGDFTTERHYQQVLISSNEVTLSAEDLTARDLSFTAGDCIEKVAGTEI